MRREGLALGLFLLLTVMVGWGVLMAQCRHECVDVNKSGHCHDFVVGAASPCMGTELCGSRDGHRVAGLFHLKIGQCLHSGQTRDQWVSRLFYDIDWDGDIEYECKAYHSCPKNYPHVKPAEPVEFVEE